MLLAEIGPLYCREGMPLADRRSKRRKDLATAQKLRSAKLTIGLPVQNGARHLEACLDSMLSQDIDGLEVIVSDNASTDRTPEILGDLASRDPRLKVFHQPINLGAARNYDFCFYKSASRYFKWQAHDDILAPGYLASTVDALDKDQGAVGVHTQTQLVDENARPLVYDADSRGYVDDTGFVWKQGLDDLSGLSDEDPVSRFAAVLRNCHNSFEFFGVWRRESMLGSGLHLPFWGSDRVFLAEMSLRGRIRVLEPRLFQRRCHVEQASSLPVNEAVRWIDPEKRFMPFFSVQGAHFRACWRAISRSPVKESEKRRCRLALLRHAVRREKFRSILREGPLRHLGVGVPGYRDLAGR